MLYTIHASSFSQSSGTFSSSGFETTFELTAGLPKGTGLDAACSTSDTLVVFLAEALLSVGRLGTSQAEADGCTVGPALETIADHPLPVPALCAAVAT